MIQPSDFKVSRERDPFLKATRVSVGLLMQGTVAVRDPADEERETTRLKIQAWHAVYGDVERKLQDMRHKILASASIQPFAYEQVNAAIEEVQAMVRNPFA